MIFSVFTFSKKKNLGYVLLCDVTHILEVDGFFVTSQIKRKWRVSLSETVQLSVTKKRHGHGTAVTVVLAGY